MTRRARSAAAAAALLAMGCGAPRRPATEAVIGAEAQAQLLLLQDILRSRNDNDPRLDRDFNALSEETKGLFRRAYRDIPPEKRNDRGTIVYLLGKNTSTPEDWEFLREAVLEPPCLSLADCAENAGASDDDVTLAYPSLVALKQAQRVLDAKPGSPEALSLIAAAKASKVRVVLRLAESLERRYAPGSRR